MFFRNSRRSQGAFSEVLGHCVHDVAKAFFDERPAEIPPSVGIEVGDGMCFFRSSRRSRGAFSEVLGHLRDLAKAFLDS